MATELATAYISLVPSLRGAQRSIQDQLDPAATRAGDSAGGHAGRSLTSRLGSVMKKSMIGVGVSAGAVLATSLAKGWGRLTNIENATAKLTGLGNSAKSVTKIMANALASVQGTAFGLDEAATTAAGMVAAGIKPGKELQGVLQTVADTATIAGKSMADTGAIFGSVAARGKLQGDDLMQLQSAGVPVLAMLAKHYKVTAAEASAMVSKGKVDFKNFAAAMHENLGGAALKSGETTVGAFKNMNAALGRFGAALLKGVFPMAKVVFGGTTKLIDKLTAAVGPLADKVSGRLIGSLKDMRSAFKAGFDGGVITGSGLDVALGKLGDGVRTVRDQAQRLYGVLKGPEVARFGLAVKAALAELKPRIVAQFQTAMDALRRSAQVLKPYADHLFATFADTARQLLPILPQIGTLLNPVGAVFKSLLPVLPTLADALGKIVTSIADAFLPILPPLLDSLTKVANAGLKVVADALIAVLDPLAKLIDKLAPLAPIVAGVWVAFKGYTLAVAAIIAVRSAMDTLALRAMYAAGSVRTFGTSLRTSLATGGLAGATAGLAGMALAMKSIALTGPSMVGGQINVMSELNDMYENATHSADKSAAAILGWGATVKNAQGPVYTLQHALQYLGISADDLAKGVSGTDDEFNAFMASLRKTKDVGGGVESALKRYHDAWKNTSVAIDQGTQATDDATSSMRDQVSASQALTNALDAMSGKAINSEQAELNLKQAALGLAEQTKAAADAGDAHARSLDSNTKAGLANRQSLLSLISQANQHAQAVVDETGSVKDATAALKSDEAQIKAAAKAAGLNTKDVQSMIDKYAAVPAKVSTEIGLTGIDAVRQNVKNLAASFAQLPADVLIKVGHRSMPGRNASGTAYWRGGQTLVGERGPELLDLPRGSKIYPTSSEKTQQALGGGANISFEINEAANADAVGNAVLRRLQLAGTP